MKRMDHVLSTPATNNNHVLPAEKEVNVWKLSFWVPRFSVLAHAVFHQMFSWDSHYECLAISYPGTKQSFSGIYGEVFVALFVHSWQKLCPFAHLPTIHPRFSQSFRRKKACAMMPPLLCSQWCCPSCAVTGARVGNTGEPILAYN